MKTEYVWANDATTQNLSQKNLETDIVTDQHGDDISLYKLTKTDGKLVSENFYIASEVPFSGREAVNEQGETVEQKQVELKHVFGQDIRPAPQGSNQAYSVTSANNGDIGAAVKEQKQWESPRIENGKMTVSVSGQDLTL
ncbi:MAG: hypothetical protein ACRBB3_05090 [Alphaproteobacteria bacterium]